MPAPLYVFPNMPNMWLLLATVHIHEHHELHHRIMTGKHICCLNNNIVLKNNHSRNTGKRMAIGNGLNAPA